MGTISAADSLYWRDFPDWSARQAAALRSLAGRPDLPNALDLEHLIEEVAALGRSEFNAVGSLIQQILHHLIKLHARPGSASAAHWQAEILAFHAALLRSYAPSMRGRLDVDAEWRRAVIIARRRLETGSRPFPNLPLTCPMLVETFTADYFDVDAALVRLAAAS